MGGHSFPFVEYIVLFGALFFTVLTLFNIYSYRRSPEKNFVKVKGKIIKKIQLYRQRHYLVEYSINNQTKRFEYQQNTFVVPFLEGDPVDVWVNSENPPHIEKADDWQPSIFLRTNNNDATVDDIWDERVNIIQGALFSLILAGIYLWIQYKP